MNGARVMADTTINVLGTLYSISCKDSNEDKLLRNCDGYTDKTTKQIVITKMPEENELGCFDVYRKKVLRHEIIHAFLFESGLHGNANWDALQGQEHPEMMVDWFAVQWEKISNAFRMADAI